MGQQVLFVNACTWQKVDSDNNTWTVTGDGSGNWTATVITQFAELLWSGSKTGTPGTLNGDTPEGTYARTGGCDHSATRVVSPVCDRFADTSAWNCCSTYSVVISGTGTGLDGLWKVKQYEQQYFWSSKVSGGARPAGADTLGSFASDDPEMVVFSDGAKWILEINNVEGTVGEFCFVKFAAYMLGTTCPPTTGWTYVASGGSETHCPTAAVSVSASGCGLSSSSSNSSSSYSSSSSSSSSSNAPVLFNGGAERASLAGWTPFGTSPTVADTGMGGAHIHNNTYSFDFHPGAGQTSGMYQLLVLPPNLTTADLSFWFYIATGVSGSAYIKSADGSTVLHDFSSLMTGNSGWQEVAYSLLPWAGQTIRLEFSITAGGSSVEMWIDDVNLVLVGDYAVAAYRFDEGTGTTADDDSVYGNDGVLKNGAVFVPGLLQNAVSLDGASQFVQIADNSSLNPTGAISISTWVNATSWNSRATIVRKGGTTAQYSLGVSQGLLQFNIPGVGLVTAAVPSAGAWHHVGAVYDGSAIKLYIDGTLAASASASGSIGTSSQPLVIGTRAATGSTSSEFFAGTIDETYLYNLPLTPAQVSLLNSGYGILDNGTLGLKYYVDVPAGSITYCDCSGVVTANCANEVISWAAQRVVLLYDSLYTIGSDSDFTDPHGEQSVLHTSVSWRASTSTANCNTLTGSTTTVSNDADVSLVFNPVSLVWEMRVGTLGTGKALIGAKKSDTPLGIYENGALLTSVSYGTATMSVTDDTTGDTITVTGDSAVTDSGGNTLAITVTGAGSIDGNTPDTGTGTISATPTKTGGTKTLFGGIIITGPGGGTLTGGGSHTANGPTNTTHNPTGNSLKLKNCDTGAFTSGVPLTAGLAGKTLKIGGTCYRVTAVRTTGGSATGDTYDSCTACKLDQQYTPALECHGSGVYSDTYFFKTAEAIQRGYRVVKWCPTSKCYRFDPTIDRTNSLPGGASVLRGSDYGDCETCLQHINCYYKFKQKYTCETKSWGSVEHDEARKGCTNPFEEDLNQWTSDMSDSNVSCYWYYVKAGLEPQTDCEDQWPPPPSAKTGTPIEDDCCPDAIDTCDTCHFHHNSTATVVWDSNFTGDPDLSCVCDAVDSGTKTLNYVVMAPTDPDIGSLVKWQLTEDVCGTPLTYELTYDCTGSSFFGRWTFTAGNRWYMSLNTTCCGTGGIEEPVFFHGNSCVSGSGQTLSIAIEQDGCA